MAQLKNILTISNARISPVTPKNMDDVTSLTTKTKKKSSINSVNSIENCINKKYDEIALSQLKQPILSEVRNVVSANISSNIPRTDATIYLQKHIDSLTSEIFFLREELKEKNDLVKNFLNKLSKPDIVVNETVKEITSLRKHPNAEQTANAIVELSNSSDRQKENDKKRSANNILSKCNKSEDHTSSKKDNKINKNEITLVESSDNNNRSNEAKNDDNPSTEEKKQTKEPIANKKSKVFILGDSMVKHIQGWEINRKLDYKENVYVRQFSGAKINCMSDYVKPCTRENNPDHIIFHVGTNDIPSTKTPEFIARSILDLAKNVFSENCSVSVSNIIPRNDQWNNKVREVNDCLARLCTNENISLIDYSRSIDHRKHLNNSKLHLNIRGSNKLRDNFMKYVKEFLS